MTECEMMNLKMEIAHLRERIRERVGGDTNAEEIDAENYELKKGLLTTQQTVAELDAKYTKAMLNLVKLDRAWKTSVKETESIREQVRVQARLIDQLQEQLKTNDVTHEAETLKLQTHVQYQQDQIAQMERQRETMKYECNEHMDHMNQLQMKIREVEGQLECMRTKQSEACPVVSQDEGKKFEQMYHETMETNAALQGESNALREENHRLQLQVQETKASLSSAMSKFLQLKEEKAMLEVHLAASNKKSQQQTRDVDLYKEEIERLQEKLVTREETILALNHDKLTLERELAEHNQEKQAEVRLREQQAYQEMKEHEKSQNIQRETLEGEVVRLQAELAASRAEIEELQHVQTKVGQLFGQNVTSNDLDLHALVSELLTKQQQMKQETIKLHKKVVGLENEVGVIPQVKAENKRLKEEYEKTRLAMERIVRRKTNSYATMKDVLSSQSVTRKVLDEQSNLTTDTSKRCSPTKSSNTQRPSKRVVYVESRYLQNTKR